MERFSAQCKLKNLKEIDDTSSIFQFVSLSNAVAEIRKFSHFETAFQFKEKSIKFVSCIIAMFS
jgi:hypothetical protein